ncbi:hypothetical protein D9611_002035 [Ephemerocybe angulata]|uniref:MYND-type domain-containing protein n=1 Tax=Ephemerocybe angulata TaxID=980116 RepID=A0A8H5CHZ1_9AGAR|nr:hypothetical protein D9611_002035 [Tulosesus angulatus]
MPRRNPRVNFTREPQWDYVPESGCVVTDEMRQILARPGFLNDQNGGKRLQYLYSNQSMGFSLQDFSPFGQACFLGITQVVEEAISSGTAPPLSTKESAFEQGYATLIILGAQRIQAGRGPPSHHHAVLKFLISQSLPLDLPDVVGFTALQHAMHGTPAMLDKEALIRELLESGASINHQNRWGSTALHQAVLRGDTLGIELLMEYGADVNIPDGNGYTVKGFYVNAGAGVNAVMEKWLLKRAGEQAPLAEKRCDKCGVTTKSLKMCAACHTVQYCSKECQSK